jgi:hypothetical protein
LKAVKYVTALLLTVKIAQQSAIISVASLTVQTIAFLLTKQLVLLMLLRLPTDLSDQVVPMWLIVQKLQMLQVLLLNVLNNYP